jgi:NAD(P)-dependent dehydrogenase (short-subunit alcohol dehydrogenase family)
VNNAALIVASSLEDTDLDLFRDVLEVNTLAPFAIIKEALQYLAASKGSVLNIGSVNAYAGEPTLLPYSVSKGALMTLTRNLGDVLHRQYGIRVNQINPGWVLTEKEVERKREHGLPDDWFAKISNMYAPSNRLISPKEIAFAAVYWLSDFCGPVSGQVVELEQHPLIGRNPQKNLNSLQ